MIKTLKKIFVIITLLFLCGCSKSNKTYSLLDIQKYKNIDISATEEIRVEWDICESESVEFYINSEDDVNYILNKLCKNDTFKKTNEARDGGLSRIYLVDKNNNEIVVSLFCIHDNKARYYYNDDDIYNKVYSIGKNLGYLE